MIELFVDKYANRDMQMERHVLRVDKITHATLNIKINCNLKKNCYKILQLKIYGNLFFIKNSSWEWLQY